MTSDCLNTCRGGAETEAHLTLPQSQMGRGFCPDMYLGSPMTLPPSVNSIISHSSVATPLIHISLVCYNNLVIWRQAG